MIAEEIHEKDEILIPAQHALKLVGREAKPESTIIDVDGVLIGGGEIVAMAGPCSVEGALVGQSRRGGGSRWIAR
jgi:3-deoxy-D-arabino-heptulosonate 7-phosphate (DAHP) synthase